ncbi:hypothetical protein FOZ60_010546, partial [Perkinsus olseni]
MSRHPLERPTEGLEVPDSGTEPQLAGRAAAIRVVATGVEASFAELKCRTSRLRRITEDLRWRPILGAMNDNSVCSVKRISDKLREPLSFSTMEDKDRLERDEHQLDRKPASSAPLDRHNASPLGTNGQSSPPKLHRNEEGRHALRLSPATSLLRSEPRRNISPPRPARTPPNLGMPPAGNGRKRAVRGRASSPKRPEVEMVRDQPQRGTVQQERVCALAPAVPIDVGSSDRPPADVFCDPSAATAVWESHLPFLIDPTEGGGTEGA